MAVVFGHDHDRRRRIRGNADVLGQIHHWHENAAQADHALDGGGHIGSAGDLGNAHHLPNLEDIDAERFLAASADVRAQGEKQDFQLVGAGKLGTRINASQQIRHVFLEWSRPRDAGHLAWPAIYGRQRENFNAAMV